MPNCQKNKDPNQRTNNLITIFIEPIENKVQRIITIRSGFSASSHDDYKLVSFFLLQPPFTKGELGG
uniref:Uncharacterized protein n=1 Tax=Planktothrix agardhii TaxID=1160 RepID=A0A1J1JBW7_PLAAG|nr:protein of unknown function [Planktothrix agardhii]